MQFAYYSPDGRYLLTSAADGTILLRDPVTHEPIGAPLVGHRGAVIPVGAAFNADSTRLITAGVDGQTLLWDVESRTQIGDPWPGGEGGSGSPDGRFVITLARRAHPSLGHRHRPLGRDRLPRRRPQHDAGGVERARPRRRGVPGNV